MICKIVRCANLPAILGYNFKKMSRNMAYIIDTQHMPHLNETPPEECQRIIETWGSRNATCDKRFVHINVNPAPQDWIDGLMSEDLLKTICREYLDAMGFGDQPYVVLIHKDKSPDRWHAHIVTTCLRIDGTRISDTNERRRSMDAVRSIERKYGLWNATMKREVKPSEIVPIQYRAGEVKRKIADLVEYARGYDYRSFEEFRAILNAFGVSCKMVTRFQGGKHRTGLVYFCINERGEQVGRCFPANQLHKCGIKDTIGHLEIQAMDKPVPVWLNGVVTGNDRIAQMGVLQDHKTLVVISRPERCTYFVDLTGRNVYPLDDGLDWASRFVNAEEKNSFDDICDFVNCMVKLYMIGSVAVTDSETPEQKRKRKRRNSSV